MGDVIDSIHIHINKGKAYGRQGKAPTGLISQHSTLLKSLSLSLKSHMNVL